MKGRRAKRVAANRHASTRVQKPPYSVPLMREVVDEPWNGLWVASTFAGCGGSSTGYRMAGFRVAYANEWDDHAREVYGLNKADYTTLDGRDVRQVKGSEITDAVAKAARECGVEPPAELDVLDGSPPCQSFSTAGKRDMNDMRGHLYYEFIRLVEELQPRVFVAENVPGLIRGQAKGHFIWICERFRKAGYNVDPRVLESEWLGVPQSRHRLIIIGVRNDLGFAPPWPAYLPYQYSVRDALPWIRHSATAAEGEEWISGSRIVRPARAGNQHENWGNEKEWSTDAPAPVINAQGLAGAREYQVLLEEQRVEFDDGRKTNVGPRPKDVTDEPAPTIVGGGKQEHHFKVVTIDVTGAGRVELKPGQVVHDQRGGFVSQGDITDEPAPTMTAGASGHFKVTEEVGPDRIVRRKFTIPEVRRLCAFPDDFKLSGKFGDQWARLGNAVPPLMARAWARELAAALNEPQPKEAA